MKLCWHANIPIIYQFWAALRYLDGANASNRKYHSPTEDGKQTQRRCTYGAFSNKNSSNNNSKNSNSNNNIGVGAPAKSLAGETQKSNSKCCM